MLATGSKQTLDAELLFTADAEYSFLRIEFYIFCRAAPFFKKKRAFSAHFLSSSFCNLLRYFSL